MHTFEISLCYCTTNDNFIDQINLETAFLNRLAENKVYVLQPKDYEVGKNKVC